MQQSEPSQSYVENDELDRLIACPQCDAIYKVDAAIHLKCVRCHTLLIAPSRRVGLKVLVLSLLSLALIYGAFTLPFLTIKRFWMTSDATLLETALAFEGPMLILSVAVVVAVLLLPLARLLMTIYVFGPMVLGKEPLPQAARIFRWSENLRPWSMAEIFVVGCGVALLKIVDLANVTIGPAFWMFAALVLLLWVQDRMVCRHSVWSALEK